MNSTLEVMASPIWVSLCNLAIYCLFRLAAIHLPDTVLWISAIGFIASTNRKDKQRNARIHVCTFSCLFAVCLSSHFTSYGFLAAFAIYADRRFSPMLRSPHLFTLTTNCIWVGLCVSVVYFNLPRELQEVLFATGVLLDLRPNINMRKADKTIKDTLNAIPFPVVYGTLCEVWGNSTCFALFSVKTDFEMAKYAAKKVLKSNSDGRKSLIDCIQTHIKSRKIDGKSVGTIEVQNETWEWYPYSIDGNSAESTVFLLVGMNISANLLYEKRYKQESTAKAALIRSFSHEVLTPLNSIMYLCSEIQSKCATPEVVTMLKTNCCLLQYVLSDVTDYAEVMSGKLEIVKTDFNLRNTVKQLISLFSYQVQKKGIDLTVSIDPLIPETIYSDERKLGQVFLNLLSNAVKNTLIGGITVDVCLVDTGQMRVQVSDTGVGIQENCLKDLFSMIVFEENKGAGFGLYVSSLIAKKLGSRRIYVKSQATSGSKFWFEVDIMRKRTQSSLFVFSPTVYWDAKDVSAIPRPLCSNIQSMDLKALNVQGGAEVLIVDDNEFNRTILRMMLDKLKIRCEEAASGLKAIENISKRGKSTYKLVLMDVEMPEMDGIEATKQLFLRQAAGELETVPAIVALTAYPSYQIREKCIGAGMLQFLSKPITIEQLHTVVNQYCQAQPL